MALIELSVAPVVSLGSLPGQGERRFVPLAEGRVTGPELNGVVLPGGIDWQWQRADGVTEINAHYVLRTDDGTLVEVRSEGLRHGPPEVMARLAHGEAVPLSAYFFRTQMRFATGAPAWAHLNRVLALASGQREASRVCLEVWRVA